jgi:hypothetical protein
VIFVTSKNVRRSEKRRLSGVNLNFLRKGSLNPTLLGGVDPLQLALEHKAEHNNCRMRGSQSAPETLGPTVSS